MEKNVGGYERIARLAAGGALLALGRRIRRRPSAGFGRRLAGRAVALAGGNLLTTAVTQRCPANAALGRNTYGRGEHEDVVDRVTDLVGEPAGRATQ